MFEKLLKKIASALGQNKIPYMIIGGQAVLLYGEPRLTRDIDITLGIGPDQLAKVLKVVEKLKLTPLVPDVSDFVRKTWVLPCQDDKTKIRVDFIFSFTPYESQALERARNIKIDNRKIKFAAPEDVIIHKVFAGRPRDIEDIKSILAKNPKVNVSYINKWLKEFDKITPEKNLLKLFKNLLENLKS